LVGSGKSAALGSEVTCAHPCTLQSRQDVTTARIGYRRLND
jgi:hypothetical protein